MNVKSQTLTIQTISLTTRKINVINKVMKLCIHFFLRLL